MPGIHMLTNGWLELESDPGLFTMLVEEFGVKGVQVEEVYDLQKSIEGPVYGFIFLFRWHDDRRSRRKLNDLANERFEKDDEKINSFFFAQQIVHNSCATHALISVLLNCEDVELGETLTRLKAHTKGMCSEDKGYAISNTPELACAHNAYAGAHTKQRQEKSNGVSSGQRTSGDTFHFVCFLPIDGHLYELDGLKPYPMNHGKLKEGHDWTYTFRCTMEERLSTDAGEQDIRFNLMAIVPDRRIAITHKLGMLRTNRSIVTEALEQLKTGRATAQPSCSTSVKKETDGDGAKELSDVANIDILQRLSLRGENETDEAANKEPILSPEMSQALPIPDLNSLLTSLENEIVHNEGLLREENSNRNNYKIDDDRRKHNYDEFICTFLTMLAHERLLADQVVSYLPASVRKGLAPRANKAAADKKKPAQKPAAGKRRKGKGRAKKK